MLLRLWQSYDDPYEIGHDDATRDDEEPLESDSR
jgi:hypothetical protein